MSWLTSVEDLPRRPLVPRERSRKNCHESIRAAVTRLIATVAMTAEVSSIAAVPTATLRTGHWSGSLVVGTFADYRVDDTRRTKPAPKRFLLTFAGLRWPADVDSGRAAADHGSPQPPCAAPAVGLKAVGAHTRRS